MKVIFITGFIRSGTTLLTRALDSHPEITCVSDPIFPFFKELYLKFYREVLEEPIDEEAPIRDCFLLEPKSKKELKEKLHTVSFTEEDVEKLQKEIKDWSTNWEEQHAPKIVPYLSELAPGSAPELLQQFLRFIKKSYGDDATEIIGLKETWCEEFIEPLIDKFPQDITCFEIIRDPRASYYSRNSGMMLDKALGDFYALLFLIRHWRKSVNYRIVNQTRQKFQGLTYEEFVHHPDDILSTLCESVGLNFHDRMTDVSNYRDGLGNPWKDNSSFDEKTEISTDSVDKWMDDLSKEITVLIEFLTGPEMEYLNYEFEMSDSDSILSKLIHYSEDPQKLRDYHVRYGYLLGEQAIQEELIRNYLLREGSLDNTSSLIEKFFIDLKTYQKFDQLDDSRWPELQNNKNEEITVEGRW